MQHKHSVQAGMVRGNMRNWYYSEYLRYVQIISCFNVFCGFSIKIDRIVLKKVVMLQPFKYILYLCCVNKLIL